ncbi:MAG: hypothetical protein ALAOOOJD_01883 [bacterium]|nr:hypothetical protein [bacterium]
MHLRAVRRIRIRDIIDIANRFLARGKGDGQYFFLAQLVGHHDVTQLPHHRVIDIRFEPDKMTVINFIGVRQGIGGIRPAGNRFRPRVITGRGFINHDVVDHPRRIVTMNPFLPAVAAKLIAVNRINKKIGEAAILRILNALRAFLGAAGEGEPLVLAFFLAGDRGQREIADLHVGFDAEQTGAGAAKRDETRAGQRQRHVAGFDFLHDVVIEAGVIQPDVVFKIKGALAILVNIDLHLFADAAGHREALCLVHFERKIRAAGERSFDLAAFLAAAAGLDADVALHVQADGVAAENLLERFAFDRHRNFNVDTAQAAPLVVERAINISRRRPVPGEIMLVSQALGQISLQRNDIVLPHRQAVDFFGDNDVFSRGIDFGLAFEREGVPIQEGRDFPAKREAACRRFFERERARIQTLFIRQAQADGRTGAGVFTQFLGGEIAEQQAKIKKDRKANQPPRRGFQSLKASDEMFFHVVHFNLASVPRLTSIQPFIIFNP